jgi:hypothetical protein
LVNVCELPETLAGAVAVIVNVVDALTAKPPEMVTVQVARAPAVNALPPAQLTEFPDPDTAVTFVNPEGIKSFTIAVVPLALPPVFVICKVYVIEPPVTTATVALLLKLKLAGVFTVVAALEQDVVLLLVQPALLGPVGVTPD